MKTLRVLSNKCFKSSWGCLLLIHFGCFSPSPHAVDTGQDSWFLVNSTVVDVNTGLLQKDRVIEIRDGIIKAIHSKNDYARPRDAKVLDLQGRFVLPGYVEMHAHVLLHPWGKDGKIMPRYDRAASLLTASPWGKNTAKC
jgi:hypothetical protein